MAISIFKAFVSTVTRFLERPIQPGADRWLVDPTTGAITGVQSRTANGPDARFVAVDITAAQQAAPTATMIADIDAIFRLNVAPYTRYRSTGTALLPFEAGVVDGSTFPGAVLQTVPRGAPLLTVGPDSYVAIPQPFVIQSTNGVLCEGTITVSKPPV